MQPYSYMPYMQPYSYMSCCTQSSILIVGVKRTNPPDACIHNSSSFPQARTHVNLQGPRRAEGGVDACVHAQGAWLYRFINAEELTLHIHSVCACACVFVCVLVCVCVRACVCVCVCVCVLTLCCRTKVPDAVRSARPSTSWMPLQPRRTCCTARRVPRMTFTVSWIRDKG